MCKIVGREGTPSLVVTGNTCTGLEDIARKREGGGARNSPPSGARVKYLLLPIFIFLSQPCQMINL